MTDPAATVGPLVEAPATLRAEAVLVDALAPFVDHDSEAELEVVVDDLLAALREAGWTVSRNG